MSRRISGGRLQGSYGVHSNTGVRKSNLSQVLSLVHTFGRLTRSDIGLKTGLNRSTVLDLVAELQDLGLVRQEVPSGAGEVGRPSVEVIASDSVVSFVVIPRLGELTVGTVGLGGRIFAQKRVSMPENATAQDFATKAGMLISQFREELKPGTKIVGIGVAAPGQVRVNTGEVRWAPALGWRDVQFDKMLEEATGLQIRLDNDASLACAAEWSFGAGRGYENMLLLLGVPSGLGGGVVANGAVIRGNFGFAGELGHMRISDDERLDYSGIPGTLEALVRRDDLESALGVSDVSDEKLFDLLRKAESKKEVSKVLETQVRYLGRAIGLLLVALNPKTVVLSGFLAIHLELRKGELLESIRSQTVSSSIEGVELQAGSLGPNLLPIGTAEIIFRELLLDPVGHKLVPAD